MNLFKRNIDKSVHKDLLEMVIKNTINKWTYDRSGHGATTDINYTFKKNDVISYKINIGIPVTYLVEVNVDKRLVVLYVFRYSRLGKLIRKMIVNTHRIIDMENLQKTFDNITITLLSNYDRQSN